MTRRILTTSTIVFVLLLAAPAGADAAGCAGAGQVPTAGTLDRARGATLCLLNAVRRAHGVRPLRADRALRLTSDAHSRQMVRHRFFAHTSAVDGSSPTARIRASSYLRGARAYRTGENIAWGAGGYATPRHIVRSWMRSAPHRQNILSRGFRHIGVGIATGAPGRVGYPAATYTTAFGARR